MKVFRPNGGNQSGKVVTGATADKKPGTAWGKSIGQSLQRAGSRQAGFGLRPGGRL